jgi:phosphatidate phosphatase APP1
MSHDARQWVVSVSGDVYAEGKASLGKRVLLKLLKRSMRVPEAAFETALFQERIARFVATDRPGRRIVVRVGDEWHALARRSRRNGHFSGVVRIPGGQSNLPRGNEQAAVLPLEVCSSEGCVAAGHAYLLPEQGVSVISDIDDTLKHSHVGCKRTLLANTFLRPFETIPGMAGLFREWAAAGAAFHYVSSSPWQLYEHLSAHLATEGFPHGSFHLRSFRLRDHLLRRVLLLRRSGKASVIRSMFRTFPSRRFLLVGDSGEHDPEIYGTMGRKFPGQVAGIYIRRLAGPRDNRERYAKAFRELPAGLVRMYCDADELRETGGQSSALFYEREAN